MFFLLENKAFCGWDIEATINTLSLKSCLLFISINVIIDRFMLNSAFSDLNSREWRVCMNRAFFKNRVGSSTKLCIFKKYIEEFKQTPHFLATEWGVQTNSAFCKSTVGLKTNFVFSETIVRIPVEFPHRGVHALLFPIPQHAVSNSMPCCFQF